MARKSVLAIAILLLAAALSFAGGAQEAEAGARLQFASWMVAEESGGEVWLPERIAYWETQHPGVKVEIVPLAWEDTPNKVTLQIQGRNAPDVFTIESLWLGKFAKMPGAVVDLNSYMDSAFTSQLVPAYKGGEMDGKMAGLVWNPNPWVLVYNKALAAKAGVSGSPKDPADFLRQAQAIHAATAEYGAGLMLGIDEYSADTLHILLWPNGGDMLDASLEPAVTSPGTVRTVRLIKDMVDAGVVPFGEAVRDLRTLFSTGRVAYIFEGPWIAGVLDGQGMSREDWTVAPWPGDVQPASHILCLAEQSQNKELAWELIKFIVTDETTTLEYFKRTGLMPLVKSQYQNPAYDSHYAKTFLTQMSALRNPNVWASQKKFELEIAFMEELQKVLLGEGGVEATMRQLSERMARTLAE
ncbi:MAG: sugar ABC transporter substrate-binding protein [Spirochaetales bacterium]|nr:sugar ABC transporter substrate-binding protein [Spirochaetales bacterium]